MALGMQPHNIYASVIKTIARRVPQVVLHLQGRARWIVRIEPYSVIAKWVANDWHDHFDNDVFPNWTGEPLEIHYAYKTYDYYLQQLERLIRSVYNNDLGGDFIDVMANLISGQLNQAFEQAWKDEDGEGEIPAYLTNAAEEMILEQYDFVDQLYRDIVDAKVDETSIDPLLARAPLWANRWTEAYNRAVALITAENGGNLEWVYDPEKEHCTTCAALHGIVARASEWEELGVHPQGAPNDLLECQGWHCGCGLNPTDKRRSPKAYATIMNIVGK